MQGSIQYGDVRLSGGYHSQGQIHRELYKRKRPPVERLLFERRQEIIK
jgi:hypothetical protein